jgi:putative nucleotidyltransferase with HDIG domain
MMPEAGLLFLDDEQNVLNALRRVFQDEEAPMAFTTSPSEALERIGRGEIAVAVSDQRMPEMTGIAFLEKVKKASPETVRILLTGHADLKIALEAINQGSVYRFLTKPWDEGELMQVVRQAAAQHALVTENRRLYELTLTQNRQLAELNGSLERKVRERTREIEELNKDLEKSFFGSVRVLAGLAEVHSKVVGSHSRRVAALSKAMASRLGMGSEEIKHSEVAALLHDVGKLAIQAEILDKEDANLLPREKELLRRHPSMGEAIVRMVPNMERAALLVRHHHERFGGGGQPDGLKGDSIPLGSRIISVADAYDNALNPRAAYQTGSPAKALQKIRDALGGDFDPKVVDALEAVIRDGGGPAGDPGEIEVGLQDLRTGMVLSREIRNARGLLLLPARTVITTQVLKTLLEYPESGRSPEGIFILRGSPAAASPAPA